MKQLFCRRFSHGSFGRCGRFGRDGLHYCSAGLGLLAESNSPRLGDALRKAGLCSEMHVQCMGVWNQELLSV